MKKKITKIILVAFIVVGVFWGGMKWKTFLYIDTCLDMGGGMNPGGYSICVIEKPCLN